MSLPEVLLWRVLRLRPGGLKFRRQYPFDRYVIDFACLETRLLIEVDGEAHSRDDRPRRDERRDTFLKEEGFGIMRLPAADILRDAAAAADAIVAYCRALEPLHRPAGGPPPRSGEEISL